MEWWVLPSVAAAAGAGFLFGSRRALASAPSSSSASPAAGPPAAADVVVESVASSPRERVLRVGNTLREAFDRIAHPADLETLADYRGLVRSLAGADFDLDGVIAYLVGDHPLLACAAAQALGEREELRGREATLVARLEGVSIYVRFLLLRLLRRVDDPAVPLDVMLITDRSWASAMGLETVRAYLGEMLRPEVVEAASARLLGRPEGQREWLVELLQPMAAPAAQLALGLLRDRHAVAAAAAVDLDAVQGFVQVLTGAAGAGDVTCQAQARARAELRQVLRRDAARSLLLVGAPGVGKSTVVRQLVAELVADGWTVFTAGAAQLLAGQSYVGQIEQRVQQLVAAVGKRAKVLWVVPDLADFVQAGRTVQTRQGLLDLLLPHLVTGELRVLAPLTPEAAEQLLRQAPALRTAVVPVRLDEAAADETLQMAREWLSRGAGDGGPWCDEALLAELFQRAQQHFVQEARPGSLLRLLALLREAVATPAGPPRRATLDDAIELVARLSGLPPAVLDERSGLDLDAVRRAFLGRVMGQPDAVDCLVERIAMLKAGLCDPRRPIGVFLFTGPTGTGKTELCRALAQYLFGSEERMLRLDMSEFQHPDAVARLIGDADDVHGRKALVHRIREQPFAVVLLDEIEKAHPMVFDLFLQVFDEGRLSDRLGRVADFRHAIVILTSNLGVRDFEGAGLGFGGREPDLQKALEEVFRREFLNRLDRVVVFRPLDAATLRLVLHKELDLVLQRRGLQRRPWAVEWDESALQFLLQQGWSPTLGARPLRRAIERHVLAPLAAAIVADRAPAGDQFLFVRSDGRSVQVEFVDPEAPAQAGGAKPAQSAAPAAVSLRTLAREGSGRPDEVAALRREVDELLAAIHDGGWAGRKAAAYAAMGEGDFWTSARRHDVLGLVELMSRIENNVARLAERLDELEQAAAAVDAAPLRRAAGRALLLQLAIAAIERGAPQDALLMVAPVHDPNGDAAATLAFGQEVLAMYHAWAGLRHMEWRVLEAAPGGATLVSIGGFAAMTLLEPEAGLHVFDRHGPQASRPCRVRVSVAAQPSAPATGKAELQAARAALQPALGATPVIVRRYRREPSPEARDRVRGWRTGRLERVLGGEFDLME